MPTLAVINFNIVCAVLGGFITIFGLVSFLLKERFYLSEACEAPHLRTIPPTDKSSDIVAGWGVVFSSCHKLHKATGICWWHRREHRLHYFILLAPCSRCAVGPSWCAVAEPVRWQTLEKSCSTSRPGHDSNVAMR